MGEEGSRSFQKKKSKKPSSFRNYTPKTSKEKERWWGWGLCGVLPCPSHRVGEDGQGQAKPCWPPFACPLSKPPGRCGGRRRGAGATRGTTHPRCVAARVQGSVHHGEEVSVPSAATGS